MVKIICENIFTFASELGAFAPWREEFPNPRTLDFRNIYVARFEKHVVLVFG